MYKVIRRRKLYPVPAFWNGISQTSLKTERIHGAVLGRSWIHWKAGQYTQIYVEAEWENLGQYFLKRFLDDRKYVQSIYRKQHNIGQRIVKISTGVLKRDLSKTSLSSLKKDYETLFKIWLNFDNHNVLPWFVGADPLQNHIYTVIQKQAPDLTDEEFIVLATSPTRSFSADEELGLLQLALAIQSAKKAAATRLANQLTTKYYWIPFGYDGPKVYDKQYYLIAGHKLAKTGKSSLASRIKALKTYSSSLKRQQQSIFKKYALSDNVKRSLRTLHTLALMTDERKEFTFPLHMAWHKVAAQLAKRLQLSNAAFRFLTTEEVLRNLNRPGRLADLARERQKNTIIFVLTAGRYKILTGLAADKLANIFMPQVAKTKVIRGMVGSQGKQIITKGKVRLVLLAKDITKLKTGEILVTGMTSPEFVPAMRRSKGIITDEGGVTCHAAIVSRELNLPCVIGTGGATQILKDGDLVEIDTAEGTVKIIQSTKK